MNMLNEQPNLIFQALERQVYYEHIQERGRQEFLRLWNKVIQPITPRQAMPLVRLSKTF